MSISPHRVRVHYKLQSNAQDCHLESVESAIQFNGTCRHEELMQSPLHTYADLDVSFDRPTRIDLDALHLRVRREASVIFGEPIEQIALAVAHRFAGPDYTPQDDSPWGTRLLTKVSIHLVGTLQHSSPSAVARWLSRDGPPQIWIENKQAFDMAVYTEGKSRKFRMINSVKDDGTRRMFPVFREPIHHIVQITLDPHQDIASRRAAFLANRPIARPRYTCNAVVAPAARKTAKNPALVAELTAIMERAADEKLDVASHMQWFACVTCAGQHGIPLALVRRWSNAVRPHKALDVEKTYKYGAASQKESLGIKTYLV